MPAKTKSVAIFHIPVHNASTPKSVAAICYSVRLSFWSPTPQTGLQEGPQLSRLLLSANASGPPKHIPAQRTPHVNVTSNTFVLPRVPIFCILRLPLPSAPQRPRGHINPGRTGRCLWGGPSARLIAPKSSAAADGEPKRIRTEMGNGTWRPALSLGHADPAGNVGFLLPCPLAGPPPQRSRH